MCLDVSRIEPYGLSEMSFGLGILALTGENRPQVVVGVDAAGIEPQGLDLLSRRRLHPS